MHRINKLIIRICAALLLLLAADASAASLPAKLNVDYADYNPLSLVIRKFRWLEKEFQQDKVQIQWTYSPSSNRALEHIQDDSVDVASSTIVSAVWSKAGGNRIKAVYVFARPELHALLVSRDSPINAVEQLKGKKIATPPGTATCFFLLRALSEVGLHRDDVEIVPMDYAKGRELLERNEVDAWSGIQPFTSLSQLENGSRELYRNGKFNAYSTLVVSEEFAQQNPDVVSRIIKVYEKARKWALRSPDHLEEIYAEETSLPLPVARLVLNRYDFFNPVIDRNDIETLREATTFLKNEKLIKQDTDLDQAINDLIDRRFMLKEISIVQWR